MEKKAISKFFAEDLNAPLKIVRQSWGAENKEAVYLRVWLKENEDGKALIFHPDPEDKRWGRKERTEHINAILHGKKKGFIVVITDHDVLPDGKYKIKDYDSCAYPIKDITLDNDGCIRATY